LSQLVERGILSPTMHGQGCRLLVGMQRQPQEELRETLSLVKRDNVDVLDHDACQKLARWFEDRWNDRWCMDISDELARIIEESWAREALTPPYHK